MPARFFVTVIVMVLFPPVALLLGGFPLAPHFGLPPGYEYQTGERFSPLGAALLWLTAAGLVWPLFYLFIGRRSEPTLGLETRPSAFPRHGWAGLGLLATGLAAGSLLPAPVAGLTTLVGAALVFDADTCRLGGGSLVTTRPAYFLILYGAGAMVGWGAEYLNRFVEVWSTTRTPGSWEYLAEITLTAAGLLPTAVAARQWLARRGFSHVIPPLPPLPRRQESRAILLFGLATLGLMGGTLWPHLLYAAAWGAPLALLSSLQLLWGGRGSERSAARVAPSIGGGLIAGGVLALTCAITGAGWALEEPFRWHGSGVGTALLGFVLFSLYGLVATQVGDWTATTTAVRPVTRQSRIRRPFPIPVKVEKGVKQACRPVPVSPAGVPQNPSAPRPRSGPGAEAAD